MTTGNGMNQLLLSNLRIHGEQIVMIVQSKHSLNIRFYLNTLWPLSETLQLVGVSIRDGRLEDDFVSWPVIGQLGPVFIG